MEDEVSPRGIRHWGRRVADALSSGLPPVAADGGRDFATLAAGVMLLLGAGLIVLTVALPPAARGSDLLILGYGAVPALVGLILLRRRRVSELALGGVAALGTAVITLATLEAGAGVGAEDNQVLYLWVAVFSFWFLGLRHALGQVGLIGIADAILLMDKGEDFAAGLTRWLVLVSTFVTVGLLIAWVHRALERQREQTARLAVIAERVRIARELHDAAGHGVTAVSIQAAAGLRFVDRDTEATRRALEDIKRTSRTTLEDMRRLLGVLRPSGAGTEPFDRVSLANLDQLVDESARAGIPVDVEISGRAVPLPPGLDQAAYRIAQEALANVHDHGGPAASARVRVSYAEDGLELEIVNRGQEAPARVPTGGKGLIGMRERVELFGGTLEAGPRRGGGFRVRAHLPLKDGALVDEP